MDKLFVYGTLAPGRPNHHILGKLAGTWEQATVKGTLRQAGWGADMGYPGINLDKHGDEIQGFLFSSEKLPEFWAWLDEFEGPAYKRVLTEVKLTDDRTVLANIYSLRDR